LATRAQLNEVERLGINTARVRAMRPRALARTDLLSDAFGREFSQERGGVTGHDLVVAPAS